jgi:aminomuconate-semialdehyde/2-hydroxymuconate-6-semialdehyde dehydrogenase
VATDLISTATAKFGNFVGGQFISGGREFDDINPADGSLIARVAEAGPEVVDAAVVAARKALRGDWGSCGVRQRAAVLYKIADGIEARFDEVVRAESADTGKPIALASRLDVPRAAANFRAFADIIKTASLEAFETETPEGKHALNYAVRKPIGVVGIITP